MFSLLFCTFLNLPPGFYNDEIFDPHYFDQGMPVGCDAFWRKECCVNFVLETLTGYRPYLPRGDLDCIEVIWERLHLTKLGSGKNDVGYAEFRDEMLYGVRQDRCVTWFIPDAGELSKCLRCNKISCISANYVEGLAPLILCVYKTLRAAEPPLAAMKAFADIFYVLLDHARVSPMRHYLEGGLKHVNESANSSSVRHKGGVVPVSVHIDVAEECYLETVDYCANNKTSVWENLVSRVSCVVKNSGLFATKYMQSSAYELVCGLVKLFMGEERSSQPRELSNGLMAVDMHLKCDKHGSKWTKWMKTSQCRN